MKFLSISNLVTHAVQSFKRFYLPVIIAIAGSVLTIAIIEGPNEPDTHIVKSIFTCLLIMPLALGSFLFAERNTKINKPVISVIVLLLAGLYWYFLAPKYPFEDYKTTVVFFVLSIAAHLWVSIAAYVNSNERIGFWRFNEALFSRMALSVIFSGVIFGGLALAIAALEQLFSFDINDRMYGDLWVVVAGIFNTWFFLSGVPDNFDEINKPAIFPKGLKIFAQYILIPLATIYMVILYAYSIKIIVQWQLPKGWVSMLIICYAIVGMLATLLAYPLRQDTNNAWVKLFTRFFYIGLIPLIVLLFIAINARISEYGITELRYYLLLIGLWLAFVAIYNIVSKEKSIKLIPVTLCIVAVLSMFGPWNVFNVSHSSQVNRLEKLLTNYGIWSKDKELSEPNKEIDTDDTKQIQSIIEYFVDRGEVHELQHIYTADLHAVEKAVIEDYKNRHDYKDSDELYKRNWTVLHEMGDTLNAMLYNDKASNLVEYAVNNSYYRANNKAISIEGFSYIYPYEYRSYSSYREEMTINLPDNKTLVVQFNNELHDVHVDIVYNDINRKIDLTSLISELEKNKKRNNLSTQLMSVADSNKQYKLIINSIYLNLDNRYNDTDRINSLDGYLLIQ